jgi:hypothetical protein
MNDFEDLLGPEPPPVNRKPVQDDYSDLIGKPSVDPQDDFADLVGRPDELKPSTFEWKDVAVKAIKSVPAIKAAGFIGELSKREEAAVAKPALDLMKKKIPGMTGALAGPAAFLVQPEKVEEDKYAELGDIFRELGWSETASATAGLAASMLLPINFLMEGLAAKKIPVGKFLNPAEDIVKNSVARQEMIDNIEMVGASQELFKSKLMKIFEKEGALETYVDFKNKVLKSPDNITARSAAIEHNEWLKSSQLVQGKVKTQGISNVLDKTERIYLDSLPVIKGMDVLGGYKGYGSFGPRLAVDVGKAETAGIYSGLMYKGNLGEALLKKGIKETAMDADAEFRLTINSLQEQGEDVAVEQLLRLKGIKNVPKLTPQEQVILDTVKEHFDTRHPILAPIYKAKTGQELGKVNNYAFALKYQDEMAPTITEILGQTGRKPKFSTTAFLKERVENLHVPRTDFFNLVDETIANQEWFIHTMPEVMNAEKKAASTAFTDFFGSNAQKAAVYTRDYLLAVTNKGQLANSTPYSEFLRKARGNITSATLGFKASSIMGQFGTIFDAIAFALPEWGVGATREILGELLKTFTLPGYRKAVLKGSKALTVRRGGEAALDDLLHEGGLSALTKLGMKPLQEADLSVAVGIESAIKKILRKNGMAAEKIDDEADMFMNLINGSSEVSYRPLALSRGEGAKTMLTFQTFFMYHWATMMHDLINRGLIRGDVQRKVASGVGLALLGAGDVAQDQARKYLFELATGKSMNKKDEPYFQRMMWSYFANVPFFGQMADALMRGRSAEPPLIRQFENAINGTRSMFKGSTPEVQIRGGMKVAEAALTTFVPMPGTGQLFDLAEKLIPKTPKKVRYPKSAQQKMKNQIKRGL